MSGSEFTISLCQYRARLESDSQYEEAMKYLIKLIADKTDENQWIHFTVSTKTLYDIQTSEKLTSKEKDKLLTDMMQSSKVEKLNCFGAISQYH